MQGTLYTHDREINLFQVGKIMLLKMSYQHEIWSETSNLIG